MCQAKSKGGKRCAIHMYGSRAVLNTVVKTTRQDPEQVTEAFKDLRKESKGLPSPTPQMVEEFAMQQKIAAQWSTELSDHDSKIIQRQWSNALETKERPDGATFHAWRETLAEVGRRSKSKLAAIGVSSALAFTMAACSSGGGDLPAPGPSTNVPEPAPTSISIIDYSQNEKLGIEANGAEATDKWGAYNQAQLEEDSPILAGTPEAYEPTATQKYSAEELQEGQKATSRFLVSQLLDNKATLDNTDANRQSYISETQSFVSSDWSGDFTAAVNERSSAVTDTMADHVIAQGYSPSYVPGEARYAMRDMQLNRAYGGDGNSVVYEYNVVYDREWHKGEEKISGRASGTYSLSIAKDASGEWKLTGWANQASLKGYDAEGNPMG